MRRESTEHFILTQRPSQALHVGNFDIFGGNFPPKLDVIDIDFAIAEAYRQAEIDLLLLLEQKAMELKRPDLAYLPFELEPRAGSLLSCWMRRRFTTQITDIKDSTKCPSLDFYLDLLKQNSVISPAR